MFVLLGDNYHATESQGLIKPVDMSCVSERDINCQDSTDESLLLRNESYAKECHSNEGMFLGNHLSAIILCVISLALTVDCKAAASSSSARAVSAGVVVLNGVFA